MSEPTDEMREFAQALFGHTDEPEPDEPERKPASNTVPREGNTPTHPSGDRDLREFARRLFGHPDH